jgi:TusA-related sulfurtransferase
MTGQTMTTEMTDLQPDSVFDGGDLDCGSGLILLIREHMLKTPVDGILEMRSSEPTVADDLPPWCRMVGHDYLGSLQEVGYVRYFVRRRAGENLKPRLRPLPGTNRRRSPLSGGHGRALSATSIPRSTPEISPLTSVSLSVLKKRTAIRARSNTSSARWPLR